jgi:hypothetical protein
MKITSGISLRVGCVPPDADSALIDFKLDFLRESPNEVDRRL